MCLEGLSWSQAQWLFGNLTFLKSLLKKGDLHTFVHPPLTAFQPAWAEMLWGRPWWELGVAGYGSPRASLNAVTPLSEEDIAVPCKLLESRKSIVVNLPLLTPHENRFWLSDGSLPIGCVVSPADLAGCASLRDYKPRPFSCAAVGAARIEEAVADSLSVETTRLKCADEIMQSVDWDISLIRLTAFDLLFHLLGANFIQESELTLHLKVRSFLTVLDSWIKGLQDRFPEASLCLMSTSGHSQGIARVNLNEILFRGGFCESAIDQPESDQDRRRRTASLLLKGQGDKGKDEPQQLALTPSWRFNLASTVCGSATQGGIFLNLQERYDRGIVESSEAPGLLAAVRRYVVETLRSELGIEPAVWQCEGIVPLGPDLIIYADGVEFHNSRSGPAVDTVNKPRSTHTAEGFVWLPLGVSPRSKAVTPLQLHELLALASGQKVGGRHG